MARTYVSKTIFTYEDKEIEVQKSQDGYYKVTCRKEQWRVVKTNLRGRNAAWFILRCTQRKTRKQLSAKQKRGKITNLLLNAGMYKMNGVEWIMTRMLHGTRPIILKAPQLFRQRVVYIEPTDREGIFSLRIIDPLTEHRSEPTDIGEGAVTQMVKTFGNQTYDRDPAGNR